MKIFLIGFMGSGKSLIGKLLAEKLGFDFLDLDQAIVEKTGTAISDFFSENGETEFRKIESAILRETASLQNIIIATGGGTPCWHENIDWMNENGATIYLSVSSNILAKRLINETDRRPLLRTTSKGDLESFIDEKLKERLEYYENAQFVCHADDEAEDIVNGISWYFFRFAK